MAHRSFFLLVSGSRHLQNAALVHQHLATALAKQPGLVIVVGNGRGCDQLVRQWASDHRVPLLVAPAHWASCGKAAGPRRNNLMLSIAQGVLAFPQAGSKGTAGVIKRAKSAGLPLRVIPA